MEKKEWINRVLIVLGVVVGIVVLVLAFNAGKELFSKKNSTDKELTSKQSDFDKVLIQTSNEINKSCPILVDQETRLDNTTVLPGKTLIYNYTLLNLEKSQISVDTIKKYVVPTILNLVRTSPDMKIFRENETTFKYLYKDKIGAFVYELTVTPEMYNFGGFK
jgi:hypothetical protein